jgi:hypothetical protein
LEPFFISLFSPEAKALFSQDNESVSILFLEIFAYWLHDFPM